MTSRLRGAWNALLGHAPPSSAAATAVERARREKAALKEQRRTRQEERLRRLIRSARLERAEQEAGQLATADAATAVALDYPSQEIRLLASSKQERSWRARSCEKEPWTVAWIERSMREGGVLYDIGANVGAFTLIAAKVGGERAKVVAFEPGYASYARLCDNIVLNQCQAAVIPLPLALGSTTGLGTFIYKTLHAGQSRHKFSDSGWSASTSPHYHQPVVSMRLDDVRRQLDLPAPNYIKLDVDGGELKVLSGAASTLADPALRSILIEIDDALSDVVVAELHGRGFELADKYKREHRAHTQVWYGEFRRRS